MKRQQKKLNREFEPWMIKAAFEHVCEGRSMHSFCGRYAIPTERWLRWIKEYQELREINDLYKDRLRNKRRRKVH